MEVKKQPLPYVLKALCQNKIAEKAFIIFKCDCHLHQRDAHSLCFLRMEGGANTELEPCEGGVPDPLQLHAKKFASQSLDSRNDSKINAHTTLRGR